MFDRGETEGSRVTVRRGSLAARRSASGSDPLRSSTGAAIALAVAVACAGCSSSTARIPGTLPMRPNVIVLLVDTLRADALGFAGYPKPTSPELDRWAARGVVFDEATTPAGWTRPAVVSLFTGLYPASHGVQDADHAMPPQLVTLAEVFRGAGYDTAAFVTNFAVHAQFGCDQGFDYFRWFDKKADAGPATPRGINYVPVGDIDAEVREYLARPRDRPLFAYIHTTDPHSPYVPPAEHLLFGKDPRSRYDGEVHYTDAVLGGWLDAIERSGLLSSSIVVLTADHGEEFLEHGAIGHGITVFQESIRVPLVVWAPGLEPSRRNELVSLTDLGPTLLEAARIPAPDGFGRQGRSFWEMVNGSAPRTEWSWAYSELVYPKKGITFSYREGNMKVVHIVRDMLGRNDVWGMFDVVADRFEQTNLSQSEPERATVLVEKMAAVRKQHVDTALAALTQPLDEDATERLRALGYVD